MNKYQKQKSREIRDIMRTDVFGRVTYKEAKRKWKKGIRAFRIGDMYVWKAADIAHLGFTREQMKEFGQAYSKILRYCFERSLAFTCEYNPYWDSYQMRFTGRSVDGTSYGVYQGISGDTLRQFRGSLTDVADRILDRLNRQLQEFHFPTVLKPCSEIESMYPRIILPRGGYPHERLYHGGLTVRQDNV